MPPGKGPAWSRAEKPEDLGATIRALLIYMGRDRRSLLAGIICALASTVLSLIGPQLLADITDSISGSILGGYAVDTGHIALIGSVLLVIYGASFVLSVSESRIIGSASERIGERMRLDLNRKMDRLPLSYLESHSIGDLMSRMTNDTDTVRSGAAESLSTAVSAACMIGGSIVMMAYTDWRLALVAMVPTAAGAAVLYWVTHASQKYFTAQQRDLGLMNSLVEESYYGHDVVRTCNGQDAAAARFEEINSRLFECSFRARVATGSMPQLMNFISNLSYVTVCVAGSMLIMEGSIGFGVIVAFIVYIKRFNQPVAEMADIVARMQSVASASERVFRILAMDEMEDVPDVRDLPEPEGRVEFRDVRFGYTPDREIIHGFSLTVEPGQKVAIVGPTGSGKTTIANLLMRFYDPDSGEILIDGVPTTSMSRRQVRERFSMVLQDSWISDGTIFENVAFTKEDATQEDVEAACAMVGIDGHIRSLPQGYGTVIGSSGMSAGQRQQLAIARAIVRDASMIILDEATSSVDTRTERKIQEAMDGLTSGRTSFVIAHRLSTIRNADVILVIRDGNVVESGSHEDLMELGGFYRMLYDSQFEGCE